MLSHHSNYRERCNVTAEGRIVVVKWGKFKNFITPCIYAAWAIFFEGGFFLAVFGSHVIAWSRLPFGINDDQIPSLELWKHRIALND